MKDADTILNELLNHEHPVVRIAVAENGYGLEKLVDDPSWTVRVTVAEQGYGLEQLMNDPHLHVRNAAKNYTKN